MLIEENKRATELELQAKEQEYEIDNINKNKEISNLKKENNLLILNLDKLTKLQQQEEHQRKLKENTVNQII